MKSSSIKISNRGNTIRATGAAANTLFHAMTNPKPEKETPTTISTPVFSEYTADGGDYYIRDHEGFKIAVVSNGSKADLIVKAVNEHAALEAVAEVAVKIKEHFIGDPNLLNCASGGKSAAVDFVNALTNLDTVRKGGKSNPRIADDRTPAILTAAEFGFRCHEKGMNLEATLQEVAKQ